MPNRKTFFIILWISLAVIFVFSLTGYCAAADKKNGETQTWEWSRENPKPGWWNWEDEKEKPVRGGYLHSASAAYIGLMNPNHWPVLDWVTITNLYGGLVYIDGQYQPVALWLAKSYEYPNPLTCVMKLRQGIRFHDGTPFNAEAVKYTIDYIKDRKNGAWSRSWIEPIESVEVVDEFTIRWHFVRPWAGFLGMMATVPGYIISQKALEGDVAMKDLAKVQKELKRARDRLASLEKDSKTPSAEKELNEARLKVTENEKKIAELEKQAAGAKDVDKFPVGTGRYMLEEAKPGNYLKLKRNPDWWFGQSVGKPEMPYLDGIVITVIPDEAIRLANLRAGKLDMMGLTSTQFMDLKDDPNFNITSQVGNHLISLKFNLVKGAAQDIRVRQAISHAIDRKALVEGLWHGQGVMASGPYHATHWCHNPALKPVTYDPEMSKKLLKEAGYPQGLTIRGHMGVTSSAVSLAEALKSMLDQVGITWKVDSLDASASSDRDKNLEYDLASSGWAYIKEPDMVATGLYHPNGGFNHGRSKNPRAMELIELGKTELDLKKRQKIYWDLEKLLYDNYEDVWIYYPIINTARNKRLLGYNVKDHNEGGEFYWFTHPGYFKDGQRTAQ